LRIRKRDVIVSAAAAGALHLVFVLAFGRTPVIGTTAYSEDVATLTDRPEIADRSGSSPMRVVLGSVEKTPIEGPGPRAALDPAAVRRPPSLGPMTADVEARLGQVYPMFAVRRNEPSSPMKAQLPLSGTPSWMDDELSRATAIAGAKRVVHALGARELPELSLTPSAEKVRIKLDPRGLAKELRLGLAPHQLPFPHEWPEPARALRMPEVLFDVLSVPASEEPTENEEAAGRKDKTDDPKQSEGGNTEKEKKEE